MSNEYPSVGAFYKGRNCLFSVWAPQSQKVEVVIGDAVHNMVKNGIEYWTVAIEDIQPGTSYWFRLNGKNLTDPASRCQANGVHGPSSVVDIQFPWTDESWKGISLSEMIIYEL